MNTQWLRHPLVLFSRLHADTETEESDTATAQDLLRIQALEIWVVRENATMSYTLSCVRLQLVSIESSAPSVRVVGEVR